MNPDIDEHRSWSMQSPYAVARDRFGPDPLPSAFFDGPKGPTPRRRPTEGERTKARSRGKASRKARRVGR